MEAGAQPGRSVRKSEVKIDPSLHYYRISLSSFGIVDLCNVNYI